MENMISRYNSMTESSVKDTDGENFPDPLSVTYNDIQLSKIPLIKKLSSGDLDKFWLFMYRNYGRVEYDDLLLNLNGIPYLGTLLPGDELFMIDMNDIQGFNKNKIRTIGD